MDENGRAQLQSELIALECALHTLENRRDRAFMDSMLHADFVEIGRSGRLYRREEIIEEFQLASELPVITTSEFELRLLAKDVFLLTYFSSHLGENAHHSRPTRRSSVWVATDKGLQLRFHQGTALESG